MIHLDLFSGIGGFAYAADQVWDDVEHIFCDNDKFCQQVLNKHWPEAKIYDDIRTITKQRLTAYAEGIDDRGNARELPQADELQTQERQKKRTAKPSGSDFRVDLLTGGFPCQPFSAAGLRRGTSDDRYLWPEMLRVIRLTKPEWVIAENVRGLVTWNEGMVLEQVCSDLEAEGYEIQPFIIPAVAVNAPHRRDRVWFVAHRKHDGSLATKKDREDSSPQPESKTREKLPVDEPAGNDGLRHKEIGRQRWEEDWHEVATRVCRVDDGLPHRVDRLKSLGNAIVPQVAIEIMKGLS